MAKKKTVRSANSSRVSTRLKSHALSKVLVVFVLVLGIGAGAYYYTRSDVSAGPNGKVAYIEMTASGFVPATVVVEPGTTVKWTNSTENPVNVTPVSLSGHTGHSFLPGFDGSELAPGDEYSFVFELPGEFSYSNSDSHGDEPSEEHTHNDQPVTGGKVVVEEE